MAVSVFLFLFTLFSGEIFALENVEILGMSKDGKSLLLNVGASDAVEENDEGQLYDDGETGNLVAEIEAVKSNNTHSYWIVRTVNEEQRPKKNHRYRLEILGVDLRDRTPEVVRTKRVAKGEDLPGPPILEDDDTKRQEAVEITANPEEAVEVMESEYTQGQAEYVDEYEKELEVARSDFTEKMVDIEKIAQIQEEDDSPLWNEEDRERALHLYPKEYPSVSTPEELPQEQKIIDTDALERIKRDGPLWSKGMSRNELREYLLASGIAREREFREKALYELHGHEFFLRYASGTKTYAGNADPYFQGINSSYTFGYEYPLGWTSKKLRSFSLEGHYEGGTNFIDLSSQNAKTTYSSMGGNLNYYLLNKPYSIGKYMFFLGIGFERGKGEMETQRLKENFGCNLVATTYNAGIKYRFQGKDKKALFPWGWGLSVLYGIKRTAYLVNDDLSNEFSNTNITRMDNKISFGMSLYL